MTDTPIGLGSELTRRTGGVMAAEGVGIAVSLGSLLLVKKVVGEERLAAAKESMAMHIILPLLTRFDGSIGKFQSMRERMAKGGEAAPAQPQGESAVELLDKASTASGASVPGADAEPFKEAALTPEERARKYADTLFDLSVMVPVGIAARVMAQTKADKLFGAPDVQSKWSFMGSPDKYWYAKVPDFVAQNVSLVAMNTVAQAPAKAVSNVMEKVLKGVGVPQESAHSMATYLTYVQGANTIGNMANVAYVTATNRKDAQALQQPQGPAR